jgi:hypothetical protein
MAKNQDVCGVANLTKKIIKKLCNYSGSKDSSLKKV